MQEFLIFNPGQERTNECVATGGILDLEIGQLAVPWNPEPGQRQPESWRLVDKQVTYDPIPEPEVQTPANLPGFYNDLAIEIIQGNLPEKVRSSAVLLQDIIDPEMRSNAFKAFTGPNGLGLDLMHMDILNKLLEKHNIKL
jgi:hypothetical protein